MNKWVGFGRWAAVGILMASCGDDSPIARADLTAPTVVSLLPANGSVGVEPTAEVRAIFSEDIPAAVVTAETFHVTQDGAEVSGERAVSGSAVSFIPDSPFAEGARCEAILSQGITDVAGNELADLVTWEFDIADLTPPSVESTVPTDGAGGLSVGVTIRFTLSENIDVASVTDASFALSGPGGVVAADRSVDGRAAELTPRAPLTESTTYTALATTDITDRAGNALSAPFEWTFTTGEAGDMGVASISPADGAVDVATSADVVLTFSEDIAAASVTATSVILKTAGVGVTSVRTVSGPIVTVNPSEPLAENTSYTLTVTSDLAGVTGATLPVDRTFTFDTADETRPDVVSIVPTNGSVDVPRGDPVVVIFSEPVAPPTVNMGTLFIEPILARKGGPVDGTFSVDGSTATFTPAEPFLSGVPHRVRVTTGIQDLAGNPLAGLFVSAFVTVDDEGPSVQSVLPVADAPSAPVNVTIVARFSEALDAATVTATSFMLRDADGAIVPGALTVLGSEVRLDPGADLIGESVYTATLTGDIADPDGNRLAAPFVWSFTTSDENLPFVVSSDPADEAVAVPGGSNITATFSEEIDPLTVTNDSFVLTRAGGGVVDATVSMMSAAVAVLDPDADLDPQVVYTAELTTDIRDTAGNAMAEPFTFSFATADVSGPSVVATVPDDAETDVSATIMLEVTFSEAIDPSTVTDGSFVLEHAAGGPVSGTVTASGSQAFFDPDSDLDSGETYRARLLATVTDVSGNPLASSFEWTFRVADVGGPVLVSTVPGDGDEGVSPSAVVIASFDEAIDPSSVTASSFFLEADGGGGVAGSIAVTGADAVLTPSARLASSTGYTAHITTDVTDIAGNPLVTPVSWSFTTADETPPTVVSTNPSDGDIDVALDVVVTVTFSESVDPGTITLESVSMRDAGGALVAGSLSSSGDTATFTPTTLSGSTEYTVTISTDVTDSAGNPLAAPVVFSFTTRDAGAPSVVSTTPTDEATGVAVDAVLQVIFSEDIAPASVTGASFRLEDESGAAVAGAISVEGGTATLTPDVDLDDDASFTATVTTAVTDIAGNPLAAAVSWTFTTEDLTAPVVESTNPADGAEGVSPGVVISAEFSEAVDASSVTESSVFLTADGGGAVNGDVAVSGTTVTFTPNSPLSGSTIYTATVTSDVTDLAGNPLTDDVVWSFTTGDSDSPFVESITPFDGETGVALDQAVRVKFSEPVDSTTVTPSSFTLTGPDGAVAADRTVSGPNATLTPDADLTGETTYTVTVTTDVRDRAGNPLSATESFTFTTLDATPPDVIAITPVDAATDVSPGVEVVIEFSEPIDAGTAPGAITLTRVSGGDVAGDISVTGEFATFTPSAPLESEAAYRVDVSTDVTDIAGNPLSSPATATFTVADVLPPEVSTFTPAAGAGDVSPTVVISVVFTEAIDAASVTTTSFSVVGSEGVVAGTVDASGSSATFTPAVALAPGSLFTVTLSTDIRDVAGNAMAAPFTWSFTTAVPDDVDPPLILSVSPGDGDVAPVTVVVTVAMSEPIDPGSVTVGSFQLRSGGLPVQADLSVSGDTLTLAPTNPLAGMWSYEIVLTTAIRDVAGNPLATAYSSTFTTSASTQPIVQTSTGYYQVVETGPIAWGDARDGAAALTHLGIQGRLATLTSVGEEAALRGQLNVSGVWLGGRQAQEPSEPGGDWQWISTEPWSYTNWRSGQPDHAGGGENHLRVDDVGNQWDDADTLGNSVRGYLVEFETVPPTVIEMSPAAGAGLVRSDARIVIEFSEPIDPATATSSTITLTGPGGAVSGAIEMIPGESRVALNPTLDLEFDADYTAQVTTGIRDLAGNALVDPVTWSFHTAPAPTVGEPAFDPSTNAYYQIVIFHGGRTWTEANTYARAQTHEGIAGQLCAIESATTVLFLLSSLDHEIPHTWIGGRQACDDPSCEPLDQWRWIKRTGQVPVTFFSWDAGQPDDVDGSEDYMMMLPTGQWEDVAVDDARVTGVLVQYPPFGADAESDAESDSE